ncbi:MAG: hypothetical protein PHT60_01810 [Acidiphilium sp.]|nr:hypothetical protein [Acidiphilium sp.]
MRVHTSENGLNETATPSSGASGGAPFAIRTGFEKSLPKIIEKVPNPALKSGFPHRLQETKQQIPRLDQGGLARGLKATHNEG